MKSLLSIAIFGALNLSVTLSDLAQNSTTGYAPCDSQIFCQGDILKAVQLAAIFDDDKTFVDKPTTKPESQVIEAFSKLGDNATIDQIRTFVSENFGNETSLLIPANLTDWVENPKFLQNITNPFLKGFGSAINEIWKDLVREQDLSGLCDGCTSSFLKIDGKFVVPGGRFREFYYWDTYFSMEGMLLSELYDTAKGMIEILLNYVETYGFVPNGARQYYLNRSQPPLLTHMVDIYYQATKDTDLLLSALPTLKKEHDYWVTRHTVSIPKSSSKDDCENFVAYRYNVNNTMPRPEGYKVDYDLVTAEETSTSKREHLYGELAAGAESGFDFSSRWANDPTLVSPDILRTLVVSDIIPADLNAIMYRNEILIQKFSKLAFENATDSKQRKSIKKDIRKYEKYSKNTFDVLTRLLLNNSTGMFEDYSITNQTGTSVWSASNVWAYWYLADKINLNVTHSAWKTVANITASNPGGLPVTTLNTGLQWDFPDAWPPLQYTTIKGLLNSAKYANSSYPERSKLYQDTAFTLANSLVGSSYCGWYQTGGSIPQILPKKANITDDGHLFEKMNSTMFGFPAGGGEYQVQAGFGWTNGVVLWLINTFGDSLNIPECN
ncbi:Trehalase [Smittium mucronatum]|uniref:Trehalase n=1 Tax=Smittium mucronatum TaxID=133383 RepID=A0A1R0GVT4_9FUNG|nr:Trehalase [Smittium mucronatum]